jgi:hypothetical protein
MAAFEIAFEATVSQDGKKITLEDLSNWLNNDENYQRGDFVRTFLLTNAAGEEIDILTLLADSDTIEYEIEADIRINILFSIVGVVTFTKLQKYTFDRIYLNKLQDALMNVGVCCGNDADTHNINTSTSFWQGAIGLTPTDNDTGIQQNLNGANAYIDLVV